MLPKATPLRIFYLRYLLRFEHYSIHLHQSMRHDIRIVLTNTAWHNPGDLRDLEVGLLSPVHGLFLLVGILT